MYPTTKAAPLTSIYRLPNTTYAQAVTSPRKAPAKTLNVLNKQMPVSTPVKVSNKCPALKAPTALRSAKLVKLGAVIEPQTAKIESTSVPATKPENTVATNPEAAAVTSKLSTFKGFFSAKWKNSTASLSAFLNKVQSGLLKTASLPSLLWARLTSSSK